MDTEHYYVCVFVLRYVEICVLFSVVSIVMKIHVIVYL